MVKIPRYLPLPPNMYLSQEQMPEFASSYVITYSMILNESWQWSQNYNNILASNTSEYNFYNMLNSVASPVERCYWCAVFQHKTYIADVQILYNIQVPIPNLSLYLIPGAYYDPYEQELPLPVPVPEPYPLPDNINDIEQWYATEPTDYYTTNVKKIHYYETIKIRYYIRKIEMRRGYPIRNFHRADFYGMLMLAVPSTHFINHAATYQDWWDNTSHRWRNVVIQRMQYESPQENLFYNSFGMIPVLGGIIDYIVNGVVPSVSVEQFPIWENLIQKHWVNDRFILSNWDKIREYLNDNGF